MELTTFTPDHNETLDTDKTTCSKNLIKKNIYFVRQENVKQVDKKNNLPTIRL
jgi:hypothetical protein